MNIIDEDESGDNAIPNAVGTPNATQDVYHHVKPGRKRANFFRYFYFNLPRLTKALLLITVATIGGTAMAVAFSDRTPFYYGDAALWIVVVFAGVYLLLGLFTRRAIWDYGSMVALAASIVYIGSIVAKHPQAPFIWYDTPVPLAAAWNLMFFASLGYFVLNWAVNMRIIVVWPDDQHFTD